ncbi:MAG: sigma-70 family RNA polymerase sigma factor, partial [Chloroflexi bacterium]|nr:sigma-70 family RNA polymerase sigma factor [Chloroflexota bacterium]
MTEEEFADVVENYTGFVYNVAYRMMNSPDDADDVVQDAFISAYRAKDRFRGDAQVTTWLYRIAVNAALMRIRKEKRRVQMTAPEDSYLEHNVADWEDTPDKAALNSELSREINAKIALLPEDMRTAVVLRDVQGLSNIEAAEILDISISALKARLHRGRVSLRDMLSDYVK